MITFKVPKYVHIVKSDKQTLGNGVAAFCFFDKKQAESVKNHLLNSPNMTVWNTSVNPTKFILQKDAKTKPRKHNYSIDTVESESFFKEMLNHNISIRLIDNVVELDKTCTLSSFCGIDAPQILD